jgi:hypothetical protein
MQALHTRQRHLDVYPSQIFIVALNVTPFVLETVCFLVPARNIKKYSMFTYSSSRCSTARHASVVNAASN